MKILIFGATGFIGNNLVKHLYNRYNISIVTRNYQSALNQFPNKIQIYEWDYMNIESLVNIIEEKDIIINLAGENIASKLWTNKQKQKIIKSRVSTGKKIVIAISKVKQKPNMLIQASAIGYYGSNPNKKLIESDINGSGFLAEVCELWEKSTKKVNLHKINHAIVRIGVVLGNNGGLFPKLFSSIKYFLGFNFGTGENMTSWIHINDVVRAIEFIIEKRSDGIHNITSPNAVKSKTINKIIATHLKRPIWFNIHKKILVLIFGEIAKEILLADQNIMPNRLLQDGFKFKHTDIEKTIGILIKKAAN